MKRRKSWLSKAIAAVALVCAIAFALFRFVFVVRSVDVIGAPAEEAPEIVRAGNVEFGGSIFGVDTQAIIAGIAETGDYYAVDVARSLPNRLHITVQQRTPVAMTLFMQSILIMDADGYVISACDSVPDMDLVYVSDLKPGGYKIGSVVQADQDRLENLRAALHAIAENGAAAYISELNVADSRAIKIISRTRTNVNLGTRENMSMKISWMVSALADLESRGESYGTLDVSSGKSADYRPANADTAAENTENG